MGRWSLLDRTAIILAGGPSKRFGREKGLVDLSGRPLVTYVQEAVRSLAEELIVVFSSKNQADCFRRAVDRSARIIIDADVLRCPIVGAVSGLSHATGKYSALLACDMPLISANVVSRLYDMCIHRDATVPRWPNGFIEPLHAVYRTEVALQASRSSLKEGRMDMRSMIERLSDVRYISTLFLQRLDSQLWTFFNINSQEDLRQAEICLRRLNVKGVWSQ